MKTVTTLCFAVALGLVGTMLTGGSAAADQIPPGWKALNMQPVGYSDLGGRAAFKLAIKRVGDRWYLCMGHLWNDGWSIVDITDPPIRST